MEKTDKQLECPSPEVISEYFDGELPADSPVAEHIRACDKCQKILDSYKFIDSELKTNCNFAIPEELTTRIKATIAEQTKPVKFPFWLCFRIAALFIICASVSFYAYHENFSTQPSSVQIATAPVEHKKQPPAYPYYNGSSQHSPGGIAVRNLIGASYGADGAPVFTDAMKTIDRAEQPVAIANQVHQVWVVNNLTYARHMLNEMVKKLNIPAGKVRIKIEGNSLKLAADLTKLELVHLVRSCKANGFSLVSPAAPQPEQNVFLGNSSSPTLYFAQFVKEK